ncbi:S-adenosyl-L-methionine-dependent methyltransferase [Coemansia mojavensis]|nr:S-adenosyl-L-methionine-dependent methyltransferase [Coemansia mojavensis]
MSLKLPKLPSIRDLTRIYNLRAKQQLSQNFLMDKNVTDKIVSLAGLELENALCVEVGPGPGLLTRSILDRGAQSVVAVEKDPRFTPTLDQLRDASQGRFTSLIGDMLTIDHSEIIQSGLQLESSRELTEFSHIHLLGNLPFNVATPMLIQWLHLLAKREGIFSAPNVSMTLMFQKEVGARLTAFERESPRGRLSVVAQSICDVYQIYGVRASSFVPRPKVDASMVQLRPLETPLLKSSLSTLEDLMRFVFMKRRKMLARIFKDWQPEAVELLEECGIDPTLRPQDVPTELFCNLAQIIEQREIQIGVYSKSGFRSKPSSKSSASTSSNSSASTL